MSFDRSLWKEVYAKNALPYFPCPRCAHGRVIFDNRPISLIEPKFSKEAHSHEAWDPDWIIERVALKGECNIPQCGEIVHAVGTATLTEFLDEDHGWSYEHEFSLDAISPAPAIIEVPEKCPAEISEDLLVSFRLFWTDYSACATRLRLSVERLLDALGVPRQGKKKSGKNYDLNLAQRIDAFSAKDSENAEILHALRFVGNVATHEGTQSLSNLLDSYEIYEEALRQLVGKKAAKLEEIRKKLLQTKGKG